MVMQVYISTRLKLLYLSFLKHFQLWNYLKKATLSGSYFFWCSFSIKLSQLQRRNNKINIILYDRYYLQYCKAITFEKIANHEEYKKPNALSHLHVFWLNSDKVVHRFPHPFLPLEETDFRKNAAWGNG